MEYKNKNIEGKGRYNTQRDSNGTSTYFKFGPANFTKKSFRSDSKYKCIGTYEDKPNSRVYYFIHNYQTVGKVYDSILEYDLLTNKVSTVYQDGRHSSSGKENYILNFDDGYLITGINKVDDILYWTDNLNRPRKINVELAKNNEENIGLAPLFTDIYFSSSRCVYIMQNNFHRYIIGDEMYMQMDSGFEASEGLRGYNGYSVITGIVKSLGSQTITVTDGSSQVVGIGFSDLDLSQGDFISIPDSSDFPYYYEVLSLTDTIITLANAYGSFGEDASTGVVFSNIDGLITDTPWIGAAGALSGKAMLAEPIDAYSPLISFGDYNHKMKYIDALKHQPNSRPHLELINDNSTKKNDIIGNVFQFRYRYKHFDQEFTAFSGISDVAIDDSFAHNSASDFFKYRDFANLIKVSYDDAISDVTDIEIVARKGNKSPFFLVETVKNNFSIFLKEFKNELLQGTSGENYYSDLSKSKIDFKNNGAYPYTNVNDTNKLYDAVPKLSKAQTVLSNNRLSYGNILEGYDNTRMYVKSRIDNGGSQFLSSTAQSIPFAIGYEETNGSSSNQFSFTTLQFDSKYEPRFDFSGLDLSDESSQILQLNFSYQFEYEIEGLPFTFYRSGGFSMEFNATGITSASELVNQIQLTINASSDNYTLLGASMANLVASTSSAIGVLKMSFFHFGTSFSADPFTDELLGAISFQDATYSNNFKMKLNSQGTESFKTGAFHDFGISYFDETNRCSFVNVAPNYSNDINGTRPYNRFESEANDIVFNQATTAKLDIYHQPPNWATHYQLMYAGNTSVDEFLQMIFLHVKVGSDDADKQIYLSMEGLMGENFSYNQISNSKIKWSFVEGDRIRFITCRVGSNDRVFKEYVDFEVAGIDLYINNDETNPISVNGTTQGWYLRINDPSLDSVPTNGENVDISHDGFSSASTSGFHQLLAEIYRPKKEVEEENLVYYEIGDKRPIENAGTPSRAHSGDSTQSSDYKKDLDTGIYISSEPTHLKIKSGDIYKKPRKMATTNSPDDNEYRTFFAEDYLLNDFHDTNHWSQGRINVINTNSAERRLESSVYYSETYSSTGAINGLNSFNLAFTPYFDYSKEYGSIQSLKTKDNDLIVFHENKVGKALVEKDIITTAAGGETITLTSNIISNYVTLYAGEYGVALNPESIVQFGNKFYFVDIRKGVVLRLSTDGLTVISDYGMKDFFRDAGEAYINNNPEKSTQGEYKVIGGYDPKYDEYIITLSNIIKSSDRTLDGMVSSIDKSFKAMDKGVSNILEFESKTLAFDEGSNKWTSFYSFKPEFYSKVARQFISFNEGDLFRHNMSDKYTNAIGLQQNNSGDLSYELGKKAFFNSFYSVSPTQKDISFIEFPFNTEPSSIKTYNALSLESDIKMLTNMSTNMGQYHTNYDKTIETSVGFKDVKGEIKNLMDNPNNSVLIGSIDSNFYEDLEAGDLVKINGFIPSNYYEGESIISSNTRIVKSILSKNKVLLTDHVGLICLNSKLEVIDYKTKEGIQYTQIPFVPSKVKVNDTYSFVGVGEGDASNVFGLGMFRHTNVSSKIGSLMAINSANYSQDSPKPSNVLGDLSTSISNAIVGGKYIIKNITPRVSQYIDFKTLFGSQSLSYDEDILGGEGNFSEVGTWDINFDGSTDDWTLTDERLNFVNEGIAHNPKTRIAGLTYDKESLYRIRFDFIVDTPDGVMQTPKVTFKLGGTSSYSTSIFFQSSTTALNQSVLLISSDNLSDDDFEIQAFDLGGDFSIDNIIIEKVNIPIGKVLTLVTKPIISTQLFNVIPAEYAIYSMNIKDNTTRKEGYVYSLTNKSIDFFFDSPNGNVDVRFWFIVKEGLIDGEKMKGHYMKTKLSVDKYQSKSKFNLYAANVDVDKSK